jgi:hypothetical protein
MEESKQINVQVYDFLKEVKLLCDYGGVFSMTKLAKSHKLRQYGRVGSFMVDENLITRTGVSRNAKYKWNTLDPNVHMSHEFITRFEAFCSKIWEEEKAKKEMIFSVRPIEAPKKDVRGGKREGAGRKSKEVENRYLDNLSFKLFWIKITIKLNYKTNK